MATATGVFINFDSLKEIKEKFKNLSEDAAKDVDAILRVSADSIADLAQKNLSGVVYNANDYKLPIEKLYARNNDIADLKQSIGVNAIAINNYEVVAKMPYAAYIEFGTGGKVTIPAGYEQFASQFKGGKGGTFAQLLKALMEWVKRKGIVGTYSVKTGRRTGNKSIQQKQNESAAYAIALSILKKGLRPHPFLIPAYEQEIPKLKTNIKRILNAKS